MSSYVMKYLFEKDKVQGVKENLVQWGELKYFLFLMELKLVAYYNFNKKIVIWFIFEKKNLENTPADLAYKLMEIMIIFYSNQCGTWYF